MPYSDETMDAMLGTLVRHALYARMMAESAVAAIGKASPEMQTLMEAALQMSEANMQLQMTAFSGPLAPDVMRAVEEVASFRRKLGTLPSEPSET